MASIVVNTVRRRTTKFRLPIPSTTKDNKARATDVESTRESSCKTLTSSWNQDTFVSWSLDGYVAMANIVVKSMKNRAAEFEVPIPSTAQHHRRATQVALRRDSKTWWILVVVCLGTAVIVCGTLRLAIPSWPSLTSTQSASFSCWWLPSKSHQRQIC
jgi:hypothetical protein